MDKIIIKYLTNRSNPEENEILLKWIEESEENKKYFLNIQHLFSAVKVNQKPTYREKVEAGIVWNNIISNDSFKQFKSIRRRRILFSAIATAAASILIFAGIGLFDVFKSNSTTNFQSNIPIKVIKSSSPTLVLSNGKEVLLSELNSELEEGGASIKQNQEKSLSYKAVANNAEVKYNTLKIPTATIFTLTLSDGTKVWLNSESELRYPVVFNKNERRVYLKGEAYFEVSKQKNKAPFIVESGALSTKVLGTHFNVCCYTEDQNQHVTLSEGSVKVSVNNSQITLGVGEQVKYNQTSRSAAKLQVDASEYSSWIEGQTCFNNVPLNELATMIKRFYGITVNISDENLATLRFSGKLLKSYDPRKIIKLISESAGLEWEVKDNTVYFLRKN